MSSDDEIRRLRDELRACTDRLEWVPDWIWEIDADGRLTYSNSVVERVLGYKPEELVGKSPFTLAEPADEHRCESILANAVENRAGLEHVTCWMHASDQSLHALDVSTVPLLDSHGSLTGFRAIARDVTEQLKSQQSTREDLANYRRLIDDSPTGIVVLQDGKVVFSNPQLLELMGYPPEDAIGADVSQFIHPDDREMVISNVARRLSGEPVPSRYEIRTVTKTGEVLHFWVQASVITYNGRPAVLDNLVHITEQKRAEEALRESEAKFKALVEKTSDWVWEVDTQGCYTYVSPRCRDMLGYEPEELIGLCYKDLMNDEEARVVQQSFEKVAAKHEPFALLQNTLIRKDGTRVIVETSGEPIINGDGEFLGYRGIDRDVTARKAAEEEVLRKTAELEAIVDAFPDIYLWLDEHDRVARYHVHDPSELYVPPESFVGKRHEEFLPPEQARQSREAIVEARLTGRTTAVEYPLPMPDGEHYYEARIVPLPDEQLLIVVRDITERRRAEEDMRRSEQFLASVFDAIQDGLSISDTQMNVIRTNRAIEEMYPHAMPLCGRKCFEVYHGREKPCEVCPSIRAMQTKSLEMDLVPYVDSNGNVAGWIELYAFPLIDHNGKVTGVVEHVRDITERKKAQDALKESEERLREQQAALASLARCEAIGNGDVDAAFRQMAEVGAKTLNVERVNFWRFNEDRSKIACVEQYQLSTDQHLCEDEIPVDGHLGYFRAIETGPIVADDAVSYESTREFAEDYLRHYGISSMNDAPLRLGGMVVGVVCFEHVGSPRQWTSDEDIFVSSIADLASIALEAAERNEAEQALRESEERYRSFVQNFQGIAYRSSLDMEPVFIHGATDAITGYPEDDFLSGRITWPDVVHPDDWHVFIEETERARTMPGYRADIEYRILHRDGHVVWLHALGGNVTDESGVPVFLQGSFYDITDQKRDQERLLRLNETLLSFGADPKENINRLVALFGELVGADAALYNRLEQDTIQVWGHWNLPPDYKIVDKAEGHVCRDVIHSGGTAAKLIRDLQKTDYRQTDPGVARYELQTYFGMAIRFTDQPVGSLCAVFTRDFVPTDSDYRLLGVVGSAIAVEEQRQRAEDALVEAEAKYRSLVDESLTGVYMIQDDRFVFVNPRLAEMTGYSQDEMVGKMVTDLAVPEDRAMILENIRRRIEGEVKSVQYSLRSVRKDGRVTDIEVFGSVTQYLGRPAIIGTALDVTESKRAAEALKQSQEIYRDLVETTDTGYLVIDMQGLVIDANAEYVRLTGRNSLEEIVGHSVLEWTAPYDIERNEHEVRKCVETGIVRNLNIDYVSPDGCVTPIEINATVTESAEGQRILTLCRDVTERRRGETALRFSEERYRVLFEESPDMLFLIEDTVIVAVNPAVTRILGYAEDEVVGKHSWDISPELQPDGMRSEDKATRILRGLREYEPVSLDWVYERKDGSLADCEVSLVAYETHGRRAAQAIVRDVTERRQAEEGRREFERQVESQKRQFYRDTILSVTDGKLDICDPPEIRQYVAESQERTDVRNPQDVATARHVVEAFCRDRGLGGERLESFMIAAGEAITNAIKHGHEGRVYMGVKNGAVWVGVSDKGRGIESLILPRATLLRGFSTKPSLGLGYSIMLDVADHILLKTDRRGTFVILIKSIEEPEVTISPDLLPDTWGNILGGP